MHTDTIANISPRVLRWALERAGIRPYSKRFYGSAALVGVDAATLGHWCNGEAQPTLEQVLALAYLLNVPFGYFWLPDTPAELDDLYLGPTSVASPNDTLNRRNP